MSNSETFSDSGAGSFGFIEDNSIVAGDSRFELKRIPDESVQLTVTSPPYNIGKDYSAGYDDGGPIEEWQLMIEDVLKQLFRVTKPDGKVVINIGKSFADSDEHGRFEFFPLASYVKKLANEIGFDFWDEIIWNKQGFASRGGGALMGSYPYPSNLMVTQTHEHILVFRKWVNDSYHKEREIPPLETKEREKSALTKERWRELTQSIWTFNGVRQSSLDVDHNAVFPEELPKRAIQLYSFVGDTVLDPFIGTGTTAVAAKKSDRDYIGIDLSEEYTEHASKRVEDVERDKDDYIEVRDE
jgi:site-specific DNA-methyltransferase (adenine-specific)